jgi:hypothetical protein
LLFHYFLHGLRSHEQRVRHFVRAN